MKTFITGLTLFVTSASAVTYTSSEPRRMRSGKQRHNVRAQSQRRRGLSVPSIPSNDVMSMAKDGLVAHDFGLDGGSYTGSYQVENMEEPTTTMATKAAKPLSQPWHGAASAEEMCECPPDDNRKLGPKNKNLKDKNPSPDHLTPSKKSCHCPAEIDEEIMDESVDGAAEAIEKTEENIVHETAEETVEKTVEENTHETAEVEEILETKETAQSDVVDTKPPTLVFSQQELRNSSVMASSAFVISAIGGAIFMIFPGY
ncbi:hypothetical protein ACHAWF_014905 [Thalassiosira exigua]